MSSIWGNAIPVGQMANSGIGSALIQGRGAMGNSMNVINGSGSSAKTAGQSKSIPLASATAQSNSSTGSSGTSGSDSAISANDFLTLLVTEMQNQDPTADTDPNEYINQLTEINSLEQLISINQNLQTALGETTTTSGSATGGTAAAVKSDSAQFNSKTASGFQSGSGQPSSAVSNPTMRPTKTHASGNLSSPGVSRAAIRVGQALNGKSLRSGGPAIKDIPTRPLP